MRAEKHFERQVEVSGDGYGGTKNDVPNVSGEDFVATQADVETQHDVETWPNVETWPDVETQPVVETQSDVETQPDGETQPVVETQPDVNNREASHDTNDIEDVVKFVDSLLPVKNPSVLQNFESYLVNNFDHYVSNE